jgi:single-strand DNA-binding protein
MASANVSIKIGNLAADPEARMSKGGKAITTFRIGVSDPFNDETQWFNVVCFDRVAEACARNLTKGRLVYVQGRDQVRSWKDDAGNWKNKHEILASQVQFLTPKGSDDSRSSSPYGGAPSWDKGGDDDEAPF